MSEKEYYRDNINLKRPGVQYEFTKEQIDEYIKCSEDPVYFLKNYMKIISLDRGIINFEMHDYQEELIKTFIDNRRVVVRSSRQSGKCLTFNSSISLKKKSTGEILEISIGDFFDKIKQTA